jgi:regulator of protease activity HflC (stomatin/prohibitin superfamily)
MSDTAPAGALPPQQRNQPDRWRRFAERHMPSVVLSLLIAALALSILYPAMVYTVPAGYLGVQWRRFGGGTELDPSRLAYEGLHVIPPWDKMILYDRRLRSIKETYNTISGDGVVVIMTVNVRFQINKTWLGVMHQSVGPDYVQTYLLPEVGNRAREVVANYTAEQVYQGTTRTQMQKDMLEAVKARFQGVANTYFGGSDGGYLTIFDTLVLGIELPPALVAAINRKNEQLYVKQEYQYRVERERLEAVRKVIEATGIRDFQATVGAGISDSYLRWRGIDATLRLAESSNAKVVIIGTAKDGLPLILGNIESPAPPPAQSLDRSTPAVNAPMENSPAANMKTPPSVRPDGLTDAASPQPPIAVPGTLSGAVLPKAPVLSPPAGVP